MMRRILRASSASVTSTVRLDTIVLSAETTSKPAACSASRTSNTIDGSQVTRHTPSPSAATSSAPASSAAIITESSSPPFTTAHRGG